VNLAVTLVLGAQTRVVLGAALLLVCLAWLHTNKAADELSKGSLLSPATWENALANLRPLELPMVPAAVLQPLSSLASGVAGLLLVLSAFVPMRLLALVPLAAAALMILGPMLRVPAVGPLSPAMTSLAGGVALWLVAVVVAWRAKTKRG
jgi:hypothetical protein